MDGSGASTPTRRRSAAWWWLILVLVVALLVGATVVGLRVILLPLGPSPVPLRYASPSAGGPAPTSATSRVEAGAPVVVREGGGPLLPDVGEGQLYAQSSTGIFRIELASGRISRTQTPDLEEHVTFLAGQGWVLVKSRWSPTGVLVRDGAPASPLPRQFDPEGYLHPAPRGRLWVEPEETTEPRPRTTLRLVELDGQPVAQQTLTAPSSAAPYSIVPDGYGDVLLATRAAVFQLLPGRSGAHPRLRLVSRGELVAVGGQRLLVRDCRPHGRCTLVLVDQQTGHRVLRPAAARTMLAKGGIGIDRNAYGDAMLSPDGRRLAVMADDASGRFRVHVIDLRSGADAVLPGMGPEENVNRQLAWTANSRWLFALTDHQLRGYDTRTQTTSSVPTGGEQLLHLTVTHAPGW